MADNPSFAVFPRIGAASLAAADTSYTAPTNFCTVITGAASGTRVAEIVVHMTATVSATTMVRFWLFDSTGAGSWFLFDEQVILAATGSQSVRQTRTTNAYSNLILPNASWSLRATVHSANAGVVVAMGADL